MLAQAVQKGFGSPSLQGGIQGQSEWGPEQFNLVLGPVVGNAACGRRLKLDIFEVPSNTNHSMAV